MKRCTAARARRDRRFVRNEPGIRARQLHERAQRLRRGLRRRRARRCCEPCAIRRRNTGSLVYCAIPWPRRNGRKARLEVARAPAEHRGVEREHDRLAAARLGARRPGSRRARPTCSSRAGTSAGCRPAPRRTPPSARDAWLEKIIGTPGRRAPRARPRGRPRGGRARARRPARAGTASRSRRPNSSTDVSGCATPRSIRGTIRWRSNAARFSRTVSSVPAPALM